RRMAAGYYDGGNDKTAATHYATTLTNLPENTRAHRDIKKRLDNLEDVIKYEDVAQHADSVITLYEMPEAGRRAYFAAHIADLKQRDEEASKKELQRIEAGFATFAKSKGGKQNQGKFYFYNITSL